jgi:hypothetical protein
MTDGRYFTLVPLSADRQRLTLVPEDPEVFRFLAAHRGESIVVTFRERRGVKE